MQRAVELLGGGILGLVVGYFLCSPLFAHVFGPTTVTWDARSCPPGVYTITSTATSQDGLRMFTATTQQVQLPRESVVQDFGEIPIGQYLVRAVAQDANGRTFDSSTQEVTGEGPIEQAAPPQPEPVPAISTVPRRNRGRQGAAQPSPAPKPRPTGKDSGVRVVPPASSGHVAPPAAVPQLMRLSQAIIDRLRAAGGVEILLAQFPWWQSVSFVDRDADGTFDAVQIEWVNGQRWMALIGR